MNPGYGTDAMGPDATWVSSDKDEGGRMKDEETGKMRGGKCSGLIPSTPLRVNQS